VRVLNTAVRDATVDAVTAQPVDDATNDSAAAAAPVDSTPDEITAVCFTPNNASLLICYGPGVTNKKSANVNAASGASSTSIEQHRQVAHRQKYEHIYELSIEAVHSAASGDHAIDYVQRWPLSTAQPASSARHWGPVTVLQASLDGSLLALGTAAGFVQLRSLAQLDRVLSSNPHDGSHGQVNAVTVSADGKLLISAGADGNVFLQSVTAPLSAQATIAAATVPSAVALQSEDASQALVEAEDIVNPSQYSIEESKQKQELVWRWFKIDQIECWSI